MWIGVKESREEVSLEAEAEGGDEICWKGEEEIEERGDFGGGGSRQQC